MPSPVDIEAIKGVSVDGETEIERHASDDEPFSALAFKIMSDPYVGKLCFFRFTRESSVPVPMFSMPLKAREKE